MKEQIIARLGDAIPNATIEVEIDGNRALIEVVSNHFESMSRVARQQAVYGCIDEFISDGRLHAVTIRALTPED